MTSHHQPIHLDRKGIIEAGAFYTPRHLVDEVGRMIAPHLRERDEDDVVIFDSAAGGGAFTLIMDERDYRLADSDPVSCETLSRYADPDRVFHGNSLCEISREKYDIPEDAYLVQVGNPPYNDTTSAYKKGEKGTNHCDEDLFDRDLGVSFLRSFNKLKTDLVCVLHPLAYLIKEANFKRLKGFRENYQLRDGVIFSSELFGGTGSAKFPIVIGLYLRTPGDGMNFENIREFSFRVLDRETGFSLGRYETTDPVIRKYPPRKNDPKESPLGLYYYTFRDINSVRRSASFQTKAHYNAIPVTAENLYHYAYLFAFKSLFDPKDPWLYGNLSPLLDVGFLEANRAEFVEFALARHPAFKELGETEIAAIRSAYSLAPHDPSRIEKLETRFRRFFDSLS